MSEVLIMTKAKVLYDDAREDDPASQEAFIASRGWLQKFMKRNGLSYRCAVSSSHFLSVVFD